MYYNQVYNFGYQWLLVMSTQLIGFSIGGIARRFLVNPPSMIWPANLVTCALFNTLHSQSYAGVGQYGGVSRERFFAFALGGAFVWCESVNDLLSRLQFLPVPIVPYPRPASRVFRADTLLVSSCVHTCITVEPRSLFRGIPPTPLTTHTHAPYTDFFPGYLFEALR